MKLLLKLLIVILIAAVAAPMLIKGADGQPLMKPSQLLPDALLTGLGFVPSRSVAPTVSLPARPESTHTPGTQVYRWQDAQGQWHYSDRPLDQKAEATLIRQTNQIQAYSPKESSSQTSSVSTTAKPAVKLPEISASSSLSGADMEALMKQVQETQRLLQERQAQIDALTQSKGQ